MELNRIKDIFDEKGIKQTWLAEKLGKNFSSINAYACNRQQPSLEMLHQIAEALDVNVRELLNTTKK